MASAWEKNYHHSDLEKVAAFLPSLLADSSLRGKTRDQIVHGVLLFADIAGFTALTEKFIEKSGVDRGTDELVQALNTYLCDILGEFLAFGGDILKFAGDAVLVLWRTSLRELARTITLVVHCSQYIQKKYRKHRMAVGPKVQLKIGISAGTMSLPVFGSSRRQYFCIFGRGVCEVKEAGQLAEGGEIILSASAWELCEQNRLKTKHLDGKKAVKVMGMDAMSWSECQEALHKLVQEPPRQRPEGESTMRPSLLLPSDPNAEEVYRKYIPDAALQKLNERVPLEFFSELRPVTIIFVQMELPVDISTENPSTVLNMANSAMVDILAPHQGKINKVLLCDKGCTFLCVLGLAGYKLPSESIRALQCALQILNVCATILGEKEAVAVAVTGGTTFCGVIGHPLRHEYTVIGPKVNLAARMMMHYPGMVSCDSVTYTASRLPPYYFRELPQTDMKGLNHPGAIYQYLGITEESIFGLGPTKKRSEYFPLLGRKKEVDLFVTCLKAYRDHGQSNILAFEGTTGSGKSHLLTDLASMGQESGHRVVSMELLELNMRQSFSALRMLMARGLGLQDCESCSERQNVLRRKLQGVIEESSYCLLNDIFRVEFPISDMVQEMHETRRNLELHSTWAKVLEKILGGECGIFIIDNAHFIDPSSWSIMSAVLRNVPLFMVVSLVPGYGRTENFREAKGAMARKITYVHLEELEASAVVQKACRDLGVFSIPRDLARFLMKRGSGTPYYCEELLRHLRSDNTLMSCPRAQDAKGQEGWEGLTTSAVESSSLPASQSSGDLSDGRICSLRPGVNLENIVLPISLKEIALTQLDRVKPLQRMILKFAAIIGPVFTTQQLSHILPVAVKHQMKPLLEMLVMDNILKWVNTKEAPEDPPEGPSSSGRAGNSQASPSTSRGRSQQPSAALAFCIPLLREAAYELWPQTQVVALHQKCAAFLEPHAHRCEACGRGDFVAFHSFAVGWEDGGQKDHTSQSDHQSWEALVLAGEQLRKEKTQATTGDGAEKKVTGQEGLGKRPRSNVTQGHQRLEPATKSQEGNCSCEAIVESVLVPLVGHYLAVGDTRRAFYYLLEAAAAYLHVSNSYMALMKLNEAEALKKTKATTISRFEEATFFRLKGEVCSRMNCIKLAKKMIQEALNFLERHFPRSSMGAFIRTQLEKLHWGGWRARSLPEALRRKKLASLLQQRSCLSMLEHLFNLEGTSQGRRFSNLAARMKVNTEKEADTYQAEDSHQG